MWNGFTMYMLNWQQYSSALLLYSRSGRTEALLTITYIFQTYHSQSAVDQRQFYVVDPVEKSLTSETWKSVKIKANAQMNNDWHSVMTNRTLFHQDIPATEALLFPDKHSQANGQCGLHVSEDILP